MKRVTLYGLFFIALALNSCKKNELPKHEEESAPVFYVQCDVNGTPLRIDAGRNNYYMNASHYQDQNNVYVYKGELEQKNCVSNCGYALTFLINDYRFSAQNAVMNVDSGLKAGNYSFGGGNTGPLVYNGTFSSLATSIGGQYDWQFSDGVLLSGGEPVVTRQLEAGKLYTLSLNYFDPAGCVMSHTNVFQAGNPLQTNIRVTNNQNQYTFSTDNGQVPNTAYTYTWDFGDGSPVSSAANPLHTYTAQSLYTIKLVLTDNHNNTCTSYYQVNTANDCEANFKSALSPVSNTKALSAITVLVTDPSGAVYSSAGISQPAGSQFEILSVEEYKANDQQEPTKKIKFRFNCHLTGPNGPININNGEAVIAVSYK